MKRIGGVLLMLICLSCLFGGCGRSGRDTVTDRRIPADDVTEFCYTYSNINYDASYQRYRFYVENGKYVFAHETREKPGDYGPATEADVTAAGTRELSAEEWKAFLALLKDGRVSVRRDSAESGDAGPWTFIYWKNDKGKYQAFDFPTLAARQALENFCASLAQKQ